MIKRLALQNFKAFGNFDHSFNALNLIAGLNGMGKSTIIQSLLLLRQSHQIQKSFSKGLFLNGEFVNIGKGIDAYWIHGNDEFIGITVEWDNDAKLDLRFKNVSSEDVLPLLTDKSTITGDTFSQALFSDRFQYLHAERIGQDDIYPTSDFMVSDQNSLGLNGEFTTYFLEKYSNQPLGIKALIHDKVVTDTLGNQIDAWLGEISPGVSLFPQSISDSEYARQFYTFEYNGQRTKRFRSTNVGFGLNYVLPVLTAILSSKEGDILFIENPEAHIHPRGQSRLGYLFAIAAANNVQLIIETHSDHILNGIRVAVKKLQLDPAIVGLFYFDRDINAESHETIVHRPRVDQNGKIDKWPDGFLDEWDNMLDELI